VAWTYTFGHGDNVDIVLERCRDGRYRTGDGWRQLTRRTEEVRVRGRKQPERWIYYDSDFGTVVGDARSEGIYPCVRWSGLREVYRDFDAARSMFDATSVEELVEQQREIRSFALCAVLADATGAVAQVHTGQVDRRPRGWTRLCPYPGWELAERTVEPDLERTRPLEINPSDGLLVTANEVATGPTGDCWTPLPEPRYRCDRLREVLASHERVGFAEMVRASYDSVDLCAARLLAIWGPLLPQRREAAELRMWASSRRPSDDAHGRRMLGLFHALHHEAVRALLAPRLGDAFTRRIFDELGLMMSFQHHLDEVLLLHKPHLLDEVGLRQVLAVAWPAAMQRVQNGRSGVPVRAKFKNALTEGMEPSFLGLSTGKLDLPGAPTAPFQMRLVEFDGMTMVGGPVFHMLFDMSRPGGWYNMAGGASESPLGPGYGAGLEDWLEGRFLPLGHPEGDPPRLRR
jgi:acyl-homoserine lactone acylase PvdQ